MLSTPTTKPSRLARNDPTHPGLLEEWIVLVTYLLLLLLTYLSAGVIGMNDSRRQWLPVTVA